MPVRSFDGGSITHAAGDVEAWAFGAVAWLGKVPSGATQQAHIVLAWLPEDESDNGDTGFGYSGGTSLNLYWWNGSTFQQVNLGANTLNEWLLVVWRKASGSNAVRYSVYNFDTDTWQHGAFSAAQANLTPPGASSTIWTGYPGGPNPDLLLAARAVWVDTLPWSPDSSGDAAIESAGLESALSNWAAASPNVLHRYDQDDVTTPVDDLIDGADQAARSGTVVESVDLPPGFAFDFDGDDATEVPVTPAAESTTAQPLGRVKRRTAPVSGESTTAQTIGARKRRSVPVAAETTTAQTLGRVKRLAVPTAVETVAAQAVGTRKRLAVPTAGELVTALAPTAGAVTPVPAAVELVTAQTLGRVKRLAVPTAVELVTAQALGASAATVLIRIGGQLVATGLSGVVRIAGEAVPFG